MNYPQITGGEHSTQFIPCSIYATNIHTLLVVFVLLFYVVYIHPPQSPVCVFRTAVTTCPNSLLACVVYTTSRQMFCHFFPVTNVRISVHIYCLATHKHTNHHYLTSCITPISQPQNIHLPADVGMHSRNFTLPCFCKLMSV